MSTRCDVLVLGAGVEGLTCALSLARAGRRVTILERASFAGGSAAAQEFHPGFRAPGLLAEAGLTRRALLAPLELEGHGLAWRDEAPALLVPHPSGCPLLVRPGSAPQENELPANEAARLRRLRERLARVAPLVAAVLDEPPPDVAAPSAGELFGLATKALRLRRLGREDMLALVRTLPSSASDWLEDELGLESLRVALVAPALCGTVLGPRAPGTSTQVFLREALGGPGPRGGPAALVEALLKACHQQDVELRLGVEPRALHLMPSPHAAPAGPEVRNGVELADGEFLEAPTIVSSLSPRRTLLELLPPSALAPALERSAGEFRSRGCTAVLRLALSRAPVFAGRENDSVEHAVSASSLLELERASDALKYRRLPEAPWIEVRVPSLSAPELAPRDAAVAVVLCHTAPHDLSGEGGWNASTRARLEEALLAALERIAPGTRATLLGRELLTPPDIEQRHGLEGGHPYDGELALDQLWLQRPSLALSRYATPLPGLFLCGPSCHPGGPFLGGAGTLAAQSVRARRPAS